MFDLWLVAQCGMQVLRYHNNDGHGANTLIDKYSQWGTQGQNECFRKLAVQEAVKDQGLITVTYTTLIARVSCCHSGDVNS